MGHWENVNWESDQSHLFVNPAYPEESQRQFKKILAQATAWPGHIWLATSGSTVQKWVGLSKQALLASAKGVNEHLSSDSSDRWALALPEFHVGGLSIRARSFLSQAKVFDFKNFTLSGKWNPAAFYAFVNQTQSTLTALVPSQLYDLLQLDLQAPKCLRAIIIGGGLLLPELLNKALEKGWNILPSYGLTECSSQIATASSSQNPQLKILSHVKVRIVEDRLAFLGSSLLSSYAYFEENQFKFIDPKVEGWFVSMDRGEIKGDELSILGRLDDSVKVGGENVDLFRLEMVLQTLRLQQAISCAMTLVAIPHARLGNVIHLVIEGTQNLEIEQQIVTAFHALVLPFERIRHVNWIKEIPRSALSKIIRKDLLRLLS